MNNASSFPPPPPSPATPTSPSVFLRRRAGQGNQALPVILTDVPASHSLYTPASAVPQSATRPFRISPSSGGGQGAMSSYNPQEWGRTGQPAAPGTTYAPHNAAAQQARTRGTRDMTGMEAQMPEPPPPYSASTSPTPIVITHSSPRTTSSTFSPVQVASPSMLGNDPICQTPMQQTPVSSTPLHQSNRLSTYLPQNANYAQQPPPSSFPPPPPGAGARDRSGSRTRGVFSSISAIASRHRTAEGSPGPRGDPYGRDALKRQSFQATSSHVAPITSHRSTASYAVNATVPEQHIPPPPAARRSASVGLVGTGASETPGTSSRDRSLTANWQPGMPLPPPPPGGPPGSRSQSAERSSDRTGDTVTQSVLAPVPHRSMGTLLSPVPATPADWNDDDPRPPRSLTEAESEAQRLGLRLETHPTQPSQRPMDDVSIMSAVELRSNEPSAHLREGFGRMAPQRESSTKGIRERRIESRSRIREPQTAVEPHNGNPWSEESKPANLVLASTNSGLISRRRHVPKAAASPRSLGHPITPSSPYDAPDTGRSAASEVGTRSAPMEHVLNSLASNPTPPFSPDSDARDRKVQSARALLGSSNTALPTPLSAPLHSGKSNSSDRQFYTPLDAASLLPSSPAIISHPSDRREVSFADMNMFAEASLERYRVFLEREISANDDLERLELFAQFFVSESRLRRDKYAEAFESIGSDVLDLTRDLWRTNSSSKRGKQPASKVDTRVGSRGCAVTPLQDPSSASSAGGAAFTPRSDDESPSSASSTGSMNRNQKAQQTYQPCLSPILSMAQSTVPDEEDSRGRAPSRWWENSDEAQSFTNGGRKVERSRRESKYMGLALGNLEDMQWDDQAFLHGEPGPSNHRQLGPNEYPPEKTGWGEESTPSHLAGFVPVTRTPQPPKMDVSRLITLPPPYPRHHPAVNNNHPELATVRATLRTLNETPEKQEFQARFDAEYIEADLDPRATDQRRREMRRQIQARVSEGTMSFAEAAQAENGFDEAELKHFKGIAKSNFHTYQRTVLQPLSAILTEKAATATQSIDILRTSLIDSATTHNPNTTQESGDELPELLEKITLIKWLFEARETLHKDLFDRQSESDALYGQVILAPYRATSNSTKIAEVTSFFASDRRERDLTFAQEVLGRFESFLAAVSDSVTRGVEAQLSAFWDIAPPLLEVVDKVPTDPSRFKGLEIAIPPAEIAENPAYAMWPMQYLYTLVSHAEKSTYQLIESQTNLLCLLHEVKTGVMSASVRVLQCKRLIAEGADAGKVEGIEREMALIKREEDGRLTKDLKERVSLVEEQWRSALGGAMGDCTRRVKGWLEEFGGWDEGLED